MGFLNEVSEYQRSKKRFSKCLAGLIAEKMDAELLADYEEAMADTTIASTSLATVLKRRGIEISDTTISRHRKGVCSCVVK